MPFPTIAPLLLAGAAGLAAPAAAPAGVPSAADAPPRYVDVYGYFTRDEQYEAWYRLTTQLRRDFDAICGDTFCEGDYSNIESLRLRCSVELATGRIGRCLWVFAGSNEDVDPDTGRIVVQAHVWRCRLPLAPRTTMDAFLTALSVPSPLYAALPGTATSIYDGLTDCL
jgi:hypothetical protein